MRLIAPQATKRRHASTYAWHSMLRTTHAEVDLVDEEEAFLTGPSLDEHNKALVKNLETATKLLTQAREAVLRENRIKFN